MLRNLLVLFLLAYLADMTHGSPFQRRGQRQRQSAAARASSWSNSNLASNIRAQPVPEPRRNEYAIIHEARRNRQMSNSRSSSGVRTKPFRRSPSSLHKAKGKGLLFPIHHETPTFSAKSTFNQERRSIPHPNPYQKATGKSMSSIRKVPVPQDPEYIY